MVYKYLPLKGSCSHRVRLDSVNVSNVYYLNGIPLQFSHDNILFLIDNNNIILFINSLLIVVNFIIIMNLD